MQLFKRNKTISNGKKIFRLYFFYLLIFSVEKSYFEKKIKVGCFSFSFRRNKLKTKERSLGYTSAFVDYYISLSKNNRNSILWFDLSLGGGTEVYSQNQFRLLQKENSILRVQYDHNYDCFLLSVPNDVVGLAISFDEIISSLSQIEFSYICINSLVGWKYIYEVIDFISKYKSSHINSKISYRCHDYHSLCPSLNLLNCEGDYCNLKFKDGCDTCISGIRLNNSEIENKVLFSEFSCLHKWREMWGNLFYNDVDEVVAFSNSTKELFLEVYPQLCNKIIVIPHFVSPLDKVVVKEHKTINIAFLGNMNLYQKGNLVIDILLKTNKDPNIRFFVLGSFDKEYKDLVVTGEYNSQEIPSLLSKYEIDIVFISSICPETFSYTTSEAISTGIPVACYNFGAPAERVSSYEKGLVLKKISPEENISEIKEFVLNLRKKRKMPL